MWVIKLFDLVYIFILNIYNLKNAIQNAKFNKERRTKMLNRKVVEKFAWNLENQNSFFSKVKLFKIIFFFNDYIRKIDNFSLVQVKKILILSKRFNKNIDYLNKPKRLYIDLINFIVNQYSNKKIYFI